MSDKMDLMKRGQRDKLREELAALAIKLKRCSEEVVYQGSAVMGVEEINAEATLQAAQELKAAQDKYNAVKAELARLEG